MTFRAYLIFMGAVFLVLVAANSYAYSVKQPIETKILVYPHIDIPGLVFICQQTQTDYEHMCIIVPRAGWQRYKDDGYGNLTGINE